MIQNTGSRNRSASEIAGETRRDKTNAGQVGN